MTSDATRPGSTTTWDALIALSPDPLIIVDATGDAVLACSPDLATIGLGAVTPGASLRDAWPDTPRARAGLADLLAGRPATLTVAGVELEIRARATATARVLALRPLRATDDLGRYQRAFDALVEGVIFVHRDGRTTYANPAAARIFRAPWDLVGSPAPARRWRVTDAGGEVVEPPATATLRDGQPRERIPLQFHRDDGTTLWVEVSTAVVAADPDGAPEIAVAVFADVTERRALDQARQRAEEARHQSDERYRALFTNLASAVALYEIVTDDAGEVVDYVWLEVNPAYERLIGRPAAELIGQRVRGVLAGTAEEWHARLDKIARVALDGEALAHEDYVPSSGRWFDNWVFRPAPRQFAAIVTETTERHRITDAIAASEARYRNLFTNLASGFALHEIITDADGAIVDYKWVEANTAFARALGLPLEALLGRSVREVLPRGEDAWRHRFGKVREILEEGAIIVEEHHIARTERFFESTSFRAGPRQWASILLDTTERHRAAATITASEARYRTLFENLASAFSLCELITDDAGRPVDYRWLEVNSAFARLLGIPAAALVGRRVREVLPVAHIQWLEEFGKVALTGEPLQLEDHRQEVDRWFEVWAYRPAAGQFAVIITETTERHRIADQIAASEARYRMLADASVDLISRHDLSGNYVYASPAARAVLGRDPAEVVGTNAFAYIAEADHAVVGGSLANILTSRDPQRVQFRVVHPDGSLRWLEAVSRTVETRPGELEIMVSSRDISEQKRMAAMVGEVDAFNQALFATVGALVIVLDRTGRTVLFNPACEQLTGWRASEVIGKPFFELFVPAEQRDGVRQVFDDLAAGMFPSRHENEWLTRTGERRWIAWANSALLDEAGEVKYVFGTGVDRTAEREVEVAMRDLNAALEQRVAERTADLAATNRELEAFSYSVSHDLRAPLRAIDGFARVIEEDHGDLLPAEARRAFGRIRAASQRLAVLIDDLLTLSRSVRAELRRAPVDLSALAGEIVDGLRRAEPARVVDVVIAAGLHAVADPALTRTVLENLLGNAWKYTGRVAHAHISFTAGPRAGTFEIRDDGAGFDMTYAHKLFGAFQRLHGTAEFPGNGVGLATARRILTRHGGDIEATAEVDRGATFTFWFGESSNVVS